RGCHDSGPLHCPSRLRPPSVLTFYVRVASQSLTAASTALLLLSEWVPGIVTTSRCGPAGGSPNGSRSPWTTSVGTVTASSSATRLFSGRPGGCSGNARQSTAAAPSAAEVRQATRAPEERPPAISGTSKASCPTTEIQAASSCAAGAGLRRPATR